MSAHRYRVACSMLLADMVVSILQRKPILRSVTLLELLFPEPNLRQAISTTNSDHMVSHKVEYKKTGNDKIETSRGASVIILPWTVSIVMQYLKRIPPAITSSMSPDLSD